MRQGRRRGYEFIRVSPCFVGFFASKVANSPYLYHYFCFPPQSTLLFQFLGLNIEAEGSQTFQLQFWILHVPTTALTFVGSSGTIHTWFSRYTSTMTIRLVTFDALHTLVTPRLPIYVQYSQTFEPYFGLLEPEALKKSFKIGIHASLLTEYLDCN